MTELNQALIGEVRWQLLNLLDARRNEAIALSILRRCLQSQSISVSEAQLLRELDYLKDKGLVDAENLAWSLTAYGLDVLEGNEAQPVGVVLERVVSDAVRLRRYEIRWRMLSLLDAGRPVGISRGLMLRALDDANLMLLDNELDQEAAYLIAKGLAEWESEHLLTITADGVDVVEYNADAPKGVGRPPQRAGG
ncbi:MAG: hypothetical protein ACFB0C_15565 [Leptolyngbyaceae cyanobacterium]